jgi:mRNA-degrading endonuclease toxin of MazEF toxin-antitoxin module
VSNDANNRFSSGITVIPLTTATKKDLPTHTKILMENGKTVSTALAEQIRTVSAESLTDYAGTLDDTKMTEIEATLLIALGFKQADIQSAYEEEPEETEPEITIPEVYVPTITLNPEPAEPIEETPKFRAKRFTKQERKMIENYLEYHTLADTAKYFAGIYNVDYKTMYSRVANVNYRAKQK